MCGDPGDDKAAEGEPGRQLESSSPRLICFNTSIQEGRLKSQEAPKTIGQVR